MLSLHRLAILRHFASVGSISATAADLGYSASAISQQLSTMEREAGVALLERTAQRAVLTDAGRELASHAALVLAAVEAAESSMRARSGLVFGEVMLSCIPGLAVVLAPHLAELQRRHPDLRIAAHQTDSAEARAAVLDARTDLAVIDSWPDTSRSHAGRAGSASGVAGLAVERMRRDAVVLAVPSGHPAAGRRGAVSAGRLADLVATETWLCALPGSQSRIAGDARLASLGVEPGRRWEFEGMHVLAALVAAGSGIALLPASATTADSRISARPLTPPMSRLVLAITRTTRHRDPALAACLETIRAALR
jgi:DNA-binding transcriptional LysR family regulator